MADVTSSATSGSVVRTVSCIVTPSDSASFDRTNISAPPLNVPVDKKKKKCQT